MSKDNYKIIVEIPEILQNDTYVVSKENFLSRFNLIFQSYEDTKKYFRVTIYETDIQIVN